jgi:hypothetical protein
MSRWLSKDVTSMPLGEIEAEITAINKKSRDAMTVEDVEYLRDLQEARRRITGGRLRGCHW